MNDLDTGVAARGSRLEMPRSRGAASGFLLILLGLWGGLIPFVGHYFNFAYTPDRVWAWTTARGWLEVLPAAATVLGGLLLLGSRNRATAMLGGWLAVFAGAWFVVGRSFVAMLGIGDPGAPVASTDWMRALLEITYFSGLGALIVFLGALALGRLSVRSLRDIRHAQRPAASAPAASAPAAGAPVPPERAPEPAPAATGTAAADEPVTERAAETPKDEPEHHRLGGLFGRRNHPTTAAR